MKSFFKRGPRIPEVGDSQQGYGGSGSRRNEASDAELLAEYGSGTTDQRAGQATNRVPLNAANGQQQGYGQQQSYGQQQGYGQQQSYGQQSSYNTQGGIAMYPGSSQVPMYGTTGGTQASYLSQDPYAQTEQQQALSPEEEEVQDLKFQIRATKQESLSSTRNALRLARETEETATNTMAKLGEQSDKIGDTERHLDISKAHASRAEDNAREIKQLNKSILRPKLIRNKRSKRQAQEEKAIQRHVDERTERELTREEVLSSQRRVDDAVNDSGPFNRFKSKFQTSHADIVDPKAQRARYQFEATQSDDELEDELDSNLDDISALSARMNLLSRAMGQEVDAQNQRLGRVSDKTSALDTRIYAGTQRLANLK
ncbi:Protein transport protein S9 plasma membrane t-SNARE [Malassezia yamatoensis]|uniref:Protein transport protein S9 plasma membrane t-SNARE n=1 Tax=Malassezia yamatoensis TaxID=253288 RepID=A0AAJ6CI58_9BASI|nr:Protein transport protein S9 plasma membrane t-SNARE [Malassezia yamatoensis]